MRKNNWIIDVALIILIFAMGLFIYFRLDRVINSVSDNERQPTPEKQIEMAVETPTPTLVFNFSGNQVEQAPDFTLTDLEGNSVTLSEFLGKPVVINFWATWCPPCKAEMPVIQQMIEDYPGEFIVMAVNAGEKEDVIREFVRDNDYDFIFFSDASNSTAYLYGVSGYPTSAFIDEDGILNAMHIGELSKDLLSAYLREIGVGE